MSKGYCEITLEGGPHNGESFKISSKGAAETLSFDSSSFFADSPDGDVLILQGQRKPGIPWFAFNREVYSKVGKKDDGSILYRYTETILVDRCEGLTQKGTRCGHEAIKGEAFCPQHKKNK